MTQLFDEYQAAQAALARDVTNGLAATMGALDLKRVDVSSPGWLSAASSVVQRGHAAGVQLGVEYAEKFRVDGAISGRFTAVPGQPDVASIVQSLTILGPYRAKKLMSGGADFGTVSRTLFTSVVGAGVRHSLDGLRGTVASTPWVQMRRIAQPGCCGFCAMLATRVYWTQGDAATSGSAVVVGRRGRARGNQPIGASYHDHCKCQVVPVSEAIQPDGYEQRLDLFEDAYQEARARAERLPGGTNAKNVISEMNKLQREGAF